MTRHFLTKDNGILNEHWIYHYLLQPWIRGDEINTVGISHKIWDRSADSKLHRNLVLAQHDKQQHELTGNLGKISWSRRVTGTGGPRGFGDVSIFLASICFGLDGPVPLYETIVGVIQDAAAHLHQPGL